MALIASTQLGPPPQGGGCVSPVNNTALLVTKANSVSTAVSTATYDQLIPASTKIRCTDEGVLKTFQEIVTENGGSIPSSGNTNTNTPGVKVKRPNCECTNLSKIKLFNNNVNVTPSNPNQIWNCTFSDGYSVQLGSYWQFLIVSTLGLKFVPLIAATTNDFVVACQSYGKTQDISSGCLQLSSKSATSLTSGTIYAYQPETDYPQNSFGTSEMIAAIMLENGVYIFSIPNGGSY